MELEILNNFRGDKVKEIDTSTEAGRKQAEAVLKQLLRAGSAVYLERVDRTYRVTGYDPGTDRLRVAVLPPGRRPQERVRSAAARHGGRKGRVTAIAPSAGG